MWAGSSFPNPLYLFIEYKILNKKTKKNNFKNVLFTFNKLKKYKTTIEKIFACVSKIPFSEKIWLLNAADRYCSTDVWPNLNSKFAEPIIILLSLIMLINGKWYNPASGLFVLSKYIIKELIKPNNIEISNNSFVFGIICFKTNKIGIININILIMFEILKTKFAINVMKDIDMRPYNPASRKFLLIFSKLKAFLNAIPFKIIIKQDNEFR